MSGPEGARHSAVHDPGDGQGPHVRPTRARTRNTPGPAGSTSGPGNPAARGVHAAIETARQRWGMPVGPVTTSPDDGRGAQDEARPQIARDPLAVLRIWTEPSPPMSAIVADLREGSRLQAAHGWAWLLPYWLFAVPAFAVACVARLLLDSSARPGRFAGLLLAALLFTVGLYLAGAI